MTHHHQKKCAVRNIPFLDFEYLKDLVWHIRIGNMNRLSQELSEYMQYVHFHFLAAKVISVNFIFLLMLNSSALAQAKTAAIDRN
jgi:hypothetical protein